jgi:hypothetical protein
MEVMTPILEAPEDFENRGDSPAVLRAHWAHWIDRIAQYSMLYRVRGHPGTDFVSHICSVGVWILLAGGEGGFAAKIGDRWRCGAPERWRWPAPRSLR